MSHEEMTKLADSDIENMDIYDVLKYILKLPSGNSYSDDVWESKFGRNIQTPGLSWPLFQTPRDRLRRRAEQLIKEYQNYFQSKKGTGPAA